jgi:hypothetical protein
MFAIEVLIVLIGAAMLWKRDRLAHHVARWQRDLGSVMHPGPTAHIYTAHRAWRNVFVPALGLTFLLVGFLLLWKRDY